MMSFVDGNDKGIRQIGWFVYERENRKGNIAAGFVAQVVAAECKRNPVCRQEIEQEMAMAVWAEIVREEMEQAQATEDESNARMAGRVCNDCGHVYPIDNSWSVCLCEEAEMGWDV